MSDPIDTRGRELADLFSTPSYSNLPDYTDDHPLQGMFGGKGGGAAAPSVVKRFDPGRPFRARYYRFDLSNDEDLQLLEEVITDCLQKKKVLRQEKWTNSATGEAFVTVNWLENTPKP